MPRATNVPISSSNSTRGNGVNRLGRRAMRYLNAGISPAEQWMSWHEAFKSRSDLEKYGSNAIGLFAMALRFTLEDLDTIASESIVDGPDDKKCDIVYVDTEERYAVIVQFYLCPVITKPAAKSDKALPWVKHWPRCTATPWPPITKNPRSGQMIDCTPNFSTN